MLYIYKKIVLHTMLLILSSLMLKAQFASTYVSNQVHIALIDANMYVEGINTKNRSSLRILGASKLYANGKEHILDNNFYEQSDQSSIVLIAYPNSTENINEVILSVDKNIILKNLSISVPTSSTLVGILLKENFESEVRVAQSFSFPEGHHLSLGAKPHKAIPNDPTEWSNVMNLKLEKNTPLNKDVPRYNSYIITPGNSSLEQYVDHTAAGKIVVFPVGDGPGVFLPVGIYNADKSAFFKVTASDMYYNWSDDFFRNVKDPLTAARMPEIRRDFVKKTWNIKHNLVEDINAAIILQHPRDQGIEAIDYLASVGETFPDSDRTMISRYQRRDEYLFNRKGHSVYGGKSISSNTFWENLDRNTPLVSKVPELGISNLVNPPNGANAVSHIAFISDINNGNTFYMKAGFSEDSMPIGVVMQTPLWESLNGEHGSNLNAENTIRISPKYINDYRIKEYEVRYTTEKTIADAGFPDDADPKLMGRRTVEANQFKVTDANRFIELAKLEKPAYGTDGKMYFRVFPKGFFPYSPNSTVNYIPSLVVEINPNSTVDKFTVTGNIATYNSEKGIVKVALPGSITDQVVGATCFFVEPITKHIVHRKGLSFSSGVWSMEEPISNILMSPLTIYVILVDVDMKDGTKKKFNEKFILR